VDEPKQSVAGLFGRVAAGYDQVGFFHQVAQRLLALAGVGHGMRIFDVACGAGAVLVPAARLVGPTGLAVGVDLAEPMAAVAARRLLRQGRSCGAVAVMDGERLGLRAGWFDVVCCASAIYLLGDQAAAIRSWLRLLRPGGRLAISEFGDLGRPLGLEGRAAGAPWAAAGTAGRWALGGSGAAGAAPVGRRGQGAGPGRAVGCGLRRR
jgi:ubiquinone/menaquinone biosynthesis C-methylase UbiE